MVTGMNVQRRQFLSLLGASLVGPSLGAPNLASIDASRLRGLLLGSLIGDALGGPLEFADEDTRSGRVPACRDWDDDRRLDQAERLRIAQSLTMLGYADVRPEPVPYGPWLRTAPAGTLTDDSRLKIILMRAIAALEPNDRLTPQAIARALIAFQPKLNDKPSAAIQPLIEEGMAEYRYASRWLLGERDLATARPLARLWSGVPNCSGQMMMLPLAGGFGGDVETTYRRTFELDFIDGPAAKDIAAAFVAGLAGVIVTTAAALSDSQRYRLLESTMRRVDPYRLADVPFVGRPLDGWLDLADSIAQRADGRPKVAFKLLETEGKPVYYWDAHFTLLVPVVMLKLCQYDPLSAMHLIIDFGHDTDSYAQVLGAMVGAVHGDSVFPQHMVDCVTSQLESEFGESIDHWVDLLTKSPL